MREFAAPTFQPLQGAWVQLRRREGNALAAPVEQVARHRRGGIGLREADAVDLRRLAGFHQVHTGHATLGNQRARGLAAVEAGDQQAGRPVHQLLTQQLLFFARVVVGDADQRLVPGAVQAALHGFEQIDEQRVRQHRDQHRHVGAALRSQRARGRVGHVTELAGSRLRSLGQLGRDGPLAPQGARDRDRADACGTRHVGQGDTPGGAWPLGKWVHGLRVCTGR
jgi:hypothetical protein